MARHRLDNYLRAYRRRLGLSQADVAALCGARSGAQISRYECGKRRPTLDNMLACEAVFGVPVKALFAGRYDKIVKSVLRRAEVRAHELTVEKPGLIRSRRLRALSSVGKLASER